MSNQRNKVRIIGGQYRRRLLSFPEAAGLRPTSDRVRETLFNWLGQDLTGRTCLDLFAGSGALGFEAASRHARRVLMVEKNRVTAESLRANGVLLGATAVEIIQGDALGFLARSRDTFDVIFLDPPFGSELLAQVLPHVKARLAPAGALYIESGQEEDPGPEWVCLRQDRAGAVHYGLWQRALTDGAPDLEPAANGPT